MFCRIGLHSYEWTITKKVELVNGDVVVGEKYYYEGRCKCSKLKHSIEVCLIKVI